MQGDFGTIQLYGDYWQNAQNFLLPSGGPDDANPDNPPVDGLGQNLEHSNVAAKGTIIAGRFVLKPRLSWQRSVRQSAPGTGDVTLDDIRAGGGLGGFDYPLDLKTDIYTARLEAAHPALGPVSGTVGAEVQHQDADTRGPAELQPSARTWNVGVFAFEEARFDALTLSAGARLDVRTIEAVPNERTTDADLLDNAYTTASGAVGASYEVLDGVVLATNLSTGFRAPTVFELYASGVHGGVAAFQRGDPTLDPERAYTADLGVRVRRDRLTAEVTGYVNAIQNYIYLANTGDTQGPDGTGLPIYAAAQTDALLTGVEAQVTVRAQPWLQVGAESSVVEGTGDGLGTDGTTGDGDVPLLPAPTAGGFVRLLPADQGPLVNPRLEVRAHRAFEQQAAGRFEPFAQFDDLPGGPNPPFGTASTRAYTRLDVSAQGTLEGLGVPLTLRIGVRNLLDAAYRDFLDTYKGYALSPGRDVRLTLSTRL
jgi:iron complex outermembrane receptor protein/hemoglobin/transferrin/lactoferrin receptor protein